MVHPVRNILNRLRWDPDKSAELYLITYRHRGAPGDVKRVRASMIGRLGRSYFTISENPEGEESIIPFHRILEIRSLQDQLIIWKSRKLNA